MSGLFQQLDGRRGCDGDNIRFAVEAILDERRKAAAVIVRRQVNDLDVPAVSISEVLQLLEEAIKPGSPG